MRARTRGEEFGRQRDEAERGHEKPCCELAEILLLRQGLADQPLRDGVGVEASRSLAIEVAEKSREVAVRPHIDEALPRLNVHDHGLVGVREPKRVHQRAAAQGGERVRALGGELKIATSAGGGSRLDILLPDEAR
jgi:hypothetical protein